MGNSRTLYLALVYIVVVQFYPWFKFYPLSFKAIKLKIKFKPRIKLNHSMCMSRRQPN